MQHDALGNMKEKLKHFMASRRVLWISHGRVREIRLPILLICTSLCLLIGLAVFTSRYFQAEVNLHHAHNRVDTLTNQNMQLSGNVLQLQKQLESINQFMANSDIVHFQRDGEEISSLEAPARAEIIANLAAIAGGLERALASMTVPLEDVEFSDIHQTVEITEAVAAFKNDSASIGGQYADAENLPDSLDTQRFLQQYVEVLEHTIERMPIASPLKGEYRRTSRFGPRVDPFRKRLSMHHGADFVGAKNAPIYATADGKITFSGRKNAYGKVVIIKHGSKLETRYAHMSKLKVKNGQRVSRGDLIGYQGSTGRSTGQHLHYEVRHRNTPIDPDIFLQVGSYFND